jgi:hypothetical protein
MNGAIDGFSYRLSVGVDFLCEQCSAGPILCIGSSMGSWRQSYYLTTLSPFRTKPFVARL